MGQKIPTTIRWVSCPKFTVLIEVDDKEKIVLAPPIVKKFIGKYAWELFDWASIKFGECTEVDIACSISRNVPAAKSGFGVSRTRSITNYVGGLKSRLSKLGSTRKK